MVGKSEFKVMFNEVYDWCMDIVVVFYFVFYQVCLWVVFLFLLMCCLIGFGWCIFFFFGWVLEYVWEGCGGYCFKFFEGDVVVVFEEGYVFVGWIMGSVCQLSIFGIGLLIQL